MKNHAFIMPVFKQPGLVARIIKVLEAPNHFFFLHVDKKTQNFSEFVEKCGACKNVCFIERIPIYHGTISQVNATINLLQATLKHKTAFDFVHLISGNDYPLRSNEQLDAFFETTEQSFMYFNYDDKHPQWKDVYEEHTNWWHSNGTENILDRFFCKHSHSRLLNRLFPRKPINGLTGGWDWCTWHISVVEFIVDAIQNTKHGRDLLKRFNHTISPCEHFFTTLLSDNIEKLNVCKHFPIRFVSWEPHHPLKSNYRPYNLDERDYERVIDSAAFFCRKVDEVVSAKFMDMVDAQRGTQYNILEHDYFI